MLQTYITIDHSRNILYIHITSVNMVQGEQLTIWGLDIAFPIIAILAVVLRFQARRIKRQKLGSDDWTIVAALVWFLASGPRAVSVSILTNG